MTTRDPADDRTLQDDRAELSADPNEGSILARGEGAPLAQDDVPSAEPPIVSQSLLGGAPIATIADEGAGPASSGMTAAEDEPIGD